MTQQLLVSHQGVGQYQIMKTQSILLGHRINMHTDHGITLLKCY